MASGVPRALPLPTSPAAATALTFFRGCHFIIFVQPTRDTSRCGLKAGGNLRAAAPASHAAPLHPLVLSRVRSEGEEPGRGQSSSSVQSEVPRPRHSPTGLGSPSSQRLTGAGAGHVSQPALTKGPRSQRQGLSDRPQTPQSRDPRHELPQKPGRVPAIQTPFGEFSSRKRLDKQ